MLIFWRAARSSMWNLDTDSALMDFREDKKKTSKRSNNKWNGVSKVI
jgi:hypothetical protein